MTHFGTGIDKLYVDVLQVFPGGMIHHALSQNERSLFGPNHSTLQHDPIFIDLSVVRKPSHGSNSLLRQVRRGLARGSITLLSDAVYLLVHLRTMKVTTLTHARHGSAHTGWMPGTDTRHLPQTTMGLPGKACNTPTSDHTLHTVTLGDSKDINVLILSKDTINRNLLLEEGFREINLLPGVFSTIDLDFRNVRLLDPQVKELHLRVRDHSNH